MTSQELSEIGVRPVERSEEGQYQEQMKRHHYLGALAKIGETVWYVATWRGQWVAQLSLSASALKCGVRDRWIGWDFANNSRFLILPGWNRPNVGSRVLSRTERMGCCCWKRLWIPDASMAACIARRTRTRGYRRTRDGYSAEADAPKLVFVRPLCRDARGQLTHPGRSPQDHAQCRTDAPTPPVLQDHSRSAPRSGTAPSLVGSAGHRRGRDAVRHARL